MTSFDNRDHGPSPPDTLRLLWRGTDYYYLGYGICTNWFHRNTSTALCKIRGCAHIFCPIFPCVISCDASSAAAGEKITCSAPASEGLNEAVISLQILVGAKYLSDSRKGLWIRLNSWWKSRSKSTRLLSKKLKTNFKKISGMRKQCSFKMLQWQCHALNNF